MFAYVDVTSYLIPNTYVFVRLVYLESQCISQHRQPVPNHLRVYPHRQPRVTFVITNVIKSHW